MNINAIVASAKYIANKEKMLQAYRYDAYYRDYDGVVEILGLVNDPNYDMSDFVGREMVFPKRWVTIGVVDPSYKVRELRV